MVYAFCMTTQAPHYAIMRIEKRKDLSAIRRCAAHHLRTVHTPNANPERGIKVLAGPTTDAEVVEIFKRAVEPLKRRKDATLCLDVFIGASPSFFASGGSLEAFEANAMAWAVRTFGADNVVCAVTHDDESTPHVQLLLAPVTKQGRLSASHWIDGPKRLSALQDSLADAMKPLGLVRGVKGSKAKHQDVRRWYGEMVPRVKAAQVQIAQAERAVLLAEAQQCDVAKAKKEVEQQRAFLTKIYHAMSEAQRDQVQRLVDAANVSPSRKPNPRGP